MTTASPSVLRSSPAKTTIAPSWFMRRMRRYRLRTVLLAYAFLLPSIAVLGVFVLYPFLDNFRLALYEVPSSPLLPTKYVGISQFTHTVTSSTFLAGLQATMFYVLMVVPAGTALGLLLAVVANQKLRGMAIYRTIFSTTVVSSVAVAAVVFNTILDPVHGLLPYFGINFTPLQSPTWALPANALIGVWLFMGLSFIFFTAGLNSLPGEVIEAARCDGAGWWVTLWKVTIPMLAPVIFYVVVIGIILNLFSFGTIDILVGAQAPSVNANVLAYQIYTQIQVNNNQGVAACISIALFFITAVLTVLQFRLVERRISYGR